MRFSTLIGSLSGLLPGSSECKLILAWASKPFWLFEGYFEDNDVPLVDSAIS